MAKCELIPGISMTGDSNARQEKGVILNLRGFYDQDSHVMPDSLKEFRGELVPGIECVWQEYIPSDYDGKNPVALVISMHGGGQSGWGQCYATSWHMVAEREGFIAVFPDAPDRKTMEEKRSAAGEDYYAVCSAMVRGLIAEMKKKFNIDPGRIYMQGMSMGDLETAAFCRSFGSELTAGGCTAGPTDPDRLPPTKVPVPMYQARGTEDSRSINPKYTRFEVNAVNRKYWMDVNGCKGAPLMTVDSGECVAYWRGAKADFVYRDVYGRAHGQTIDDAERAWTLLFSHTRRDETGAIVPGEIPDVFDHGAVAVVSGSKRAYVDGKIVEMPMEAYYREDVARLPKFIAEGGEPPAPGVIPEMVDKFVGRTLYAPASFLVSAFGGEIAEKGDTATIFINGLAVEIALGNTAALVNGRVENMGRCAEAGLCIPVVWFARKILRLNVREEGGAAYINDKPGEMTPDFAGIIREFLF